MTYHLIDLLTELAASGKCYHEFIREVSMSVGLYQLDAGSMDPQKPHAEDEVYYVISGKAHIKVKDAVHTVQPGSILFVQAGDEHLIYDIEENLTALVFFAPPETVA